MKPEMKKLIIANLPYLLFVYLFGKLGQTYRQVAGVVVDIGGDLSHGSIILREIGLPAITNCGRATQTFQTGDEVELDAGRGQAMRIVA